MFKKIVFILFLSVTSMPPLIEASSSAQPTIVETIKNSRGIGKWLGTIIPCLLSLISAEISIRCNRDNPDRKEVVLAAKLMRLISIGTTCFFLDEWMKTDF